MNSLISLGKLHKSVAWLHGHVVGKNLSLVHHLYSFFLCSTNVWFVVHIDRSQSATRSESVVLEPPREESEIKAHKEEALNATSERVHGHSAANKANDAGSHEMIDDAGARICFFVKTQVFCDKRVCKHGRSANHHVVRSSILKQSIKAEC